jgi:hypothetical protein
MIERL